ncbi:MAG: NAD-dependent epimerase/dehydratase family protein [Planctomycetota bacterium]|jgi:UDP-glucuronate 4-epimerase
MDRILITGGAGFIGSQLSARLLADGKALRILDNFDPYYAEEIKRRRLTGLGPESADTWELLEGDIRNPEDCARALDGVTAVVHLAALAGVRPSIAEPVRYMDVNVTGTQTLLEAMQGQPNLPFVFGSSSSVYGGNEKVPFAESDPVDHPVSPYAASKKAGEVLCHSHHHLHGNPVTCLRFFTVYGPGQRPEMAIHLFSRKILAGEPIQMFGDGSTSRDYTFVSDIVDGIVAALDRANGYRIYNLGGSTRTTLKELIQMLEAAFGTKAIIEQKPEQPGDVRRTYADIALAQEELGYDCRVSLEEGLRSFASWYRQERDGGYLP